VRCSEIRIPANRFLGVPPGLGKSLQREICSRRHAHQVRIVRKLLQTLLANLERCNRIAAA
jgi:hypothetical protein